jgi:phosphoribosylformimino-5-aminoimidazole carboxamide ribotide isomerase
VERWPEIAFQASGGVRDAADLAALAESGVSATISGKALLEGRIEPEELRRFLRDA